MIVTPADAWATEAPIPTISYISDQGHGSGCQHVHKSGCYIYHSHTEACLRWRPHQWVPNLDSLTSTWNHCQYCKSNASTYAAQAYCSSCKEDSGAGWTYCQACARLSGSTSSGQCYQYNGCGQATQTLNCIKDTYADCIVPNVSSCKGDGKWVNAASSDVTLSGSNIAQTSIDGEGFTASSKVAVAENGDHMVQVKSPSGHIKTYKVNVGNIDREKPDAPQFELTAIE